MLIHQQHPFNDFDELFIQLQHNVSLVKAIFQQFIQKDLAYDQRSYLARLILGKIKQKSDFYLKVLLDQDRWRNIIFDFYEAFEKSYHLELMQNEIHQRIAQLSEEECQILSKAIFENIFKYQSIQSLSLIDAINQNQFHEIYEHFIFAMSRNEILLEYHFFQKINQSNLSDRDLKRIIHEEVEYWLSQLSLEMSFHTGAPHPIIEDLDDLEGYEDKDLYMGLTGLDDEDESMKSLDMGIPREVEEAFKEYDDTPQTVEMPALIVPPQIASSEIARSSSMPAPQSMPTSPSAPTSHVPTHPPAPTQPPALSASVPSPFQEEEKGMGKEMGKQEQAESTQAKVMLDDSIEWAKSQFIDADVEKTWGERIASEEMGQPGGIEHILKNLKIALKGIYHLIGLRAIKIIHLGDVLVGQVTEYFQQIFRTFRNIKSAYRVWQISQNQSIVGEMTKEVEHLQQKLGRLWKISHAQKNGDIFAQNTKPSLQNPLVELVELRDQLDQIKTDLQYLHVGEIKSQINGSLKDFILSFIPNPLSAITPFKDMVVLLFAKRIDRSGLTKLYEQFVDESNLFLENLAKAHQPKSKVLDRFNTQSFENPNDANAHKQFSVDHFRHQINRLLFHSLDTHYHAQPQHWHKQELLKELASYLLGEYRDLDMIVSLELEKYIKPILFEHMRSFVKSIQKQEQYLVFLGQIQGHAFVKEEASAMLSTHLHELKLREKIYLNAFKSGRIF